MHIDIIKPDLDIINSQNDLMIYNISFIQIKY